jgi:hypothetical protein
MTRLTALLVALLLFTVGIAGGYYGCVKFPPPPHLTGVVLSVVNGQTVFAEFTDSRGETHGVRFADCMADPKCKAEGEALERAGKLKFLELTVPVAEQESWHMGSPRVHDNRIDYGLAKV